jgi:hypothetical protein
MPVGGIPIWRTSHFEAGTKYPTARVVDRNGDVVVAGDFSSSAVIRVFDMSSATPTTAIFSNTLAIGSVIHGLTAWDIDDEGQNFQTSITSNNVAWEGGHTYRVSCLLPHVSQGYIPVVFDLVIESLYSL